MSKKSDWIPFLAGTLGPLVLKSLGMTWITRGSRASYYYQRLFGSGTRAVYSIWHCDIMLLGYFSRNEGIRVLISEHRDGELSARIIRKMGFGAIRGSTTRGGLQALLTVDKILKEEGVFDLAFTPDGPRGPRKKLQKGVIYAASRTGFPLIPIGTAVDRYWEIGSWDRLRIPKPFSRCYINIGPEIHVPPNLKKEDLDPYREQVEESMVRSEEQAKEALKKWLNGSAP